MLICQGADRKTAEDIAEETVLAVWRKSQHATANGGDVSALVYIHARNLRIDRLRRQAVWQGYCDQLETFEALNCSGSAIGPSMQRRDKMRRALEKLPSQQLQIIRLSFVEGLSPDEIARKLALPVSTVNFWTRQAFHKLQGAMEGRS